MGELMRRRAMMAAASSGSDLLYSLSSYTAEAGTSIDTGVAPFCQGVACTIACDITTKANPTTSGAVGSEFKLFRVNDNNGTTIVLAVGKSYRSNNYINAWWMNAPSEYGYRTAKAERKRFVVTHAADSDSIVIYDKLGSAAVGTLNLEQAFVATNGNLFIGSQTGAAATQQLPSSVINRFEVFNRVWTQSEIDAFFA